MRTREAGACGSFTPPRALGLGGPITFTSTTPLQSCCYHYYYCNIALRHHTHSHDATNLTQALEHTARPSSHRSRLSHTNPPPCPATTRKSPPANLPQNTPPNASSSDLVMCRKQSGISIGRLCDKCDGKCPVCDSYVRPTTLARICDECSFGNYQNKCVVCGGEGISDAFYCFECTRLEKDRDGCPKIINLGSSRTDLFYQKKNFRNH